MCMWYKAKNKNIKMRIQSINHWGNTLFLFVSKNVINCTKNKNQSRKTEAKRKKFELL